MVKYEELNDFITVDGTKFDYRTLPEAQLVIKCKKICTIYFMQESIVIDESSRIVYIPYDQLKEISLFQIKSGKMWWYKPNCSCYFWLNNEMEYHSPLYSLKDFEKIADYMLNNHPEILVDVDSNKGKSVF